MQEFELDDEISEIEEAIHACKCEGERILLFDQLAAAKMRRNGAELTASVNEVIRECFL